MDFVDWGDGFNAELLNFFGTDQSLVRHVDVLLLDGVFLDGDCGLYGHGFVFLDLLHVFVFHGDDFLGLDVFLDWHLNLKKN